MSRGRAGLVLILLGLVGASPPARAQYSLDVETGVADAGYNDIRIPGRGGTDISFTDDLHSKRTAFVRLRGAYRWGDRHNLSLLVAPLRLEAEGVVDHSVVFAGAEFAARSPLTGYYRFDSYRLTYRWDFLRRESLRFGFGFTAKIRDAETRIESGGRSGTKKNTGFVPILNFALDWRFRPPLRFIFEGDALAAPQGRAADVFAGISGEVRPWAALKAGYRILEGGADNDEVYTFALVHYAVAGLEVRL